MNFKVSVLCVSRKKKTKTRRLLNYFILLYSFILIFTFYFLQNLPIQHVVHNPRYSLTCKCSRYPTRIPWQDHRNRSYSRPNLDWSSLSAPRSHHVFVLPKSIQKAIPLQFTAMKCVLCPLRTWKNLPSSRHRQSPARRTPSGTNRWCHGFASRRLQIASCQRSVNQRKRNPLKNINKYIINNINK